MDQDLNEKHETIKLLEETRENLDDLAFGNFFFRYNMQSMIHETNKQKVGLKTENLCSAKNSVKRM